MPDWSAAVTLPIDRHRFLKVSICNRLMLKSALQRLLPVGSVSRPYGLCPAAVIRDQHIQPACTRGKIAAGDGRLKMVRSPLIRTGRQNLQPNSDLDHSLRPKRDNNPQSLARSNPALPSRYIVISRPTDETTSFSALMNPIGKLIG